MLSKLWRRPGIPYTKPVVCQLFKLGVNAKQQSDPDKKPAPKVRMAEKGRPEPQPTL